jgi:hypothetical protein
MTNKNSLPRGNPPILICRVGWMHWYRGLSNADPIKGGGSFVQEHGYGHEMFNFSNHQDMAYGYVQAKNFVIAVDRLGGEYDSESIEHVDVVWVATHPTDGGQLVVGWFRDASVYRNLQEPPNGFDRSIGEDVARWNITANYANVRLLEPDQRVYAIPSTASGLGTIGQSNVFYADDQLEILSWLGSLRTYIQGGSRPNRKSGKKRRKKQDLNLKVKIEHAAVNAVTEWYESLDYEVRSVERDNVGWDLEAVHEKRGTRLVEVKGKFAAEVSAELTPNEYRAMLAERDFRLAIVTEALSNPILHVFLLEGNDDWQDAHGCSLDITEKTGAMVKA